MSYFLAFAGFAALIILHEAGHFAAAKAVGMRVERFALFFPPLIARFRPKGGETEYGIGLIPLGGYVKITGMNPAEDIPPDVLPRAYFRQPVWKRIVVIAAGPLVNIVLAFIIVWLLLLSQGTIKDGLGVADVQPQTPAAKVLQPGDRILSIDGVKGYEPGLTKAQIDARAIALRNRINAHRCAGKLVDRCVAAKPAAVRVLRDGRTVSLQVRPRYDATPDTKRMLLGFAFGDKVDVGPGEAVTLSVSYMWRVTKTTVDSIVKIFYDSKARKQVSGVVGSYEATRQAVKFDTVRAFSILALISLSLGIINLFPFLPLDGGHIFWALAEKVRGRPIPFSVMERVGIVGFMLVIFLFYIGLSNDIGRLTSGQGFGTR
ncbi:MAG: regulator of sigma protease [Solirubrobacteraceae bacterium]|nr:regulator of sigma protease [Solirubrobacteraceae bacterium]